MLNAATQTNREGLQALPDSVTPENTKPAQKRTPESGNGIALPVVVSEWQKNTRETVRISLSVYQGRQTIDYRLWYDSGDGILKPSPKGLTLALAHLPTLADGIAKALQIAMENGLVNNEGGET